MQNFSGFLLKSIDNSDDVDFLNLRSLNFHFLFNHIQVHWLLTCGFATEGRNEIFIVWNLILDFVIVLRDVRLYAQAQLQRLFTVAMALSQGFQITQEIKMKAPFKH